MFRDKTAPLWTQILSVITVSYLAYPGVIVIGRIEREDRTPKEESGEDWESRASRMPLKLISYTY